LPFRGSGLSRGPRVFPPRGRTLRIGYSLRVFGLLQYRPYWLGGPTLPLAVSPAVWSSCKRLRWHLIQIPVEILSRVSPPSRVTSNQTWPTGRSQSAPLMGFCSLQHMKEPKVHFPRARPPATFRLQGLATLLTVYALRFRAGFISHRQRSWDSPFGAFSSRKVSGPLPPGWTHLPFCLSVLLSPKRWAGPIGRGSWASALSRVPGDPAGF